MKKALIYGLAITLILGLGFVTEAYAQLSPFAAKITALKKIAESRNFTTSSTGGKFVTPKVGGKVVTPAAGGKVVTPAAGIKFSSNVSRAVLPKGDIPVPKPPEQDGLFVMFLKDICTATYKIGTAISAPMVGALDAGMGKEKTSEFGNPKTFKAVKGDIDLIKRTQITLTFADGVKNQKVSLPATPEERKQFNQLVDRGLIH